jgi:hypothetical protein
VIYREPKPIRRPLGHRPDPKRIVAARDAGGRWIRAVNWVDRDGIWYALGYIRHSRLFGERQRQTRAALLMSMAYTRDTKRASEEISRQFRNAAIASARLQ